MINLVKMDFYRMFRMLAFYAIFLILLLAMFLTLYIPTNVFSGAYDPNDIKKGIELLKQECDVFIGLGEFKQIPRTINELNSMTFSNSMVNMLALIFVSVFCSAEYKSGFIKNIAGQVPHKHYLAVSRLATITLYNAIYSLIIFASEIIFSAVFQNCIIIKDTKELVTDILVYMLLYISESFVCVAICYITKSQTITNTFAVTISTGIISGMLMLVSMLFEYLWEKEVDLSKYTISGSIAVYGNDRDETGFIVILGFVYIVLSTVLSIIALNKRDTV